MTQIPIFNFSRHDINKKGFFRYIPLNDIHIGSHTFQQKAFENTVDYILKSNKNKEPVYWSIDGDAIENVTANCIADPYDQAETPTNQVERLISYLKPIKAWGLFGINGNHANRTKKRAYYDLMVSICNRLDIKYLGIGGYIRFDIGKQQYVLATQHGEGGAQNWELEIKRLRNNYPDAHVYIMGHDHNLEISYKPYQTVIDGKELQGCKLFCRSGNFLGFADYARIKSYEQKITGNLVLKFHANKHLITGFKMQYLNNERIQER